MNCFPCKGPACNSCKKFDRTNELVRNNALVTCMNCGFKAKLSEDICPQCGKQLITPPGPLGMK